MAILRPSRASFTFWSVLHDALPTAHFLWRRRITASPLCQRCSLHDETQLHVLRDCVFTRRIWLLILDTRCFGSFLADNDITSWISSNLRPPWHFSTFSSLWPYVFRQIVHDIWCNHKARIYNSRTFLDDPHDIAKRSLRKSRDLLSTWHRDRI